MFHNETKHIFLNTFMRDEIVLCEAQGVVRLHYEFLQEHGHLKRVHVLNAKSLSIRTRDNVGCNI